MGKDTLRFKYITSEAAKHIFKDVMESSTDEIYNSLLSNKIDIKKIGDYRLRLSSITSSDRVLRDYQGLKELNLDYNLNAIKISLMDYLQDFLILPEGAKAKDHIPQTAIQKLGKVTKAFEEIELRNQGVKSLFDMLFNKVYSGDFEYEKLGLEYLTYYLDKITIEEGYEQKRYTMEEFTGEFPKIMIMVFHIWLDKIEEEEIPRTRSFKWTGNEQSLSLIYDYLLDNHFIEKTPFNHFKQVFNNVPADTLPSKIVWIDRAKGPYFNVGLLVDIIYHLSNEGFVHKDYQGKAIRNEAISSCFILKDGSVPRLDNKKVTPYNKMTKKLNEFLSFIQNIPSIPS